MTPRMLRLGLSFIVGLGCWFGKVQAQEPADSKVVQTRGILSAGRGVLQPSANPDGSMRDFFHRHGYGCGQHLDWYGCGGWHAQNTFVFGSCRTFFGEPCLPQQPRERGLFGGGCK